MAFVRGLQALVASLVLGAGFGHAAMGRTKRGAVWLALAMIAAAAMTQSIWFLAVFAALWLGALVDAFVLGVRTQQDPPFRWVQRNTIVIFISSITCFIALRLFVIEAFHSPSTSMAPTLVIGDHNFTSKLGSPELGDIIVFRYPCAPDRDYVKRMIARGGDTVEVRCNVVYVNGRAIPNTLVEKPDTCSYADYDEAGGRWFTRQCSRYRETLGSHTYEVFHDPERPARDARELKASDTRDFPFLGYHGVPSCSLTDEASTPGQVAGTIVETKPPVSASPCEPQLHYVVPAGHVFVMGDNRNNSNDSRIWGGVPVSAIKGHVVGIWATNRPGEGVSLARFGGVE